MAQPSWQIKLTIILDLMKNIRLKRFLLILVIFVHFSNDTIAVLCRVFSQRLFQLVFRAAFVRLSE